MSDIYDDDLAGGLTAEEWKRRYKQTVAAANRKNKERDEADKERDEAKEKLRAKEVECKELQKKLADNKDAIALSELRALYERLQIENTTLVDALMDKECVANDSGGIDEFVRLKIQDNMCLKKEKRICFRSWLPQRRSATSRSTPRTRLRRSTLS